MRQSHIPSCLGLTACYGRSSRFGVIQFIILLVTVKLKFFAYATDLVVRILTIYLPGANLGTLYLGSVLYGVKPVTFFLLNVPVNTTSSRYCPLDTSVCAFIWVAAVNHPTIILRVLVFHFQCSSILTVVT